jgi:hypothetical protein
MGNNESNKEEELEYYMQIDDKIYGAGQIYLSTKFPNCYIIKTIRHLENPEQFRLFAEIENKQNLHLIGLYGYCFAKGCDLQCEWSNKNMYLGNKFATSYWEYLPYSLLELIEYRKARNIRFEEEEIWHIMKTCICAYNTF